MNRQFRQVDIIARQDNLMHRRLARFELDDVLRGCQAAVHFGQQIARCDAEGLRHTPTTASHAANQLGLFGPGLPEQNGFFIAVHPGRNIRKVDLLFDDLYLTVSDHFFDKSAQSELIQIRHRIIFQRCRHVSQTCPLFLSY